MSKYYQPGGRYHVTFHIAVALIVMIMFVAVSYFFFLANPDEQARHLDMLDEFEANRELWESRKPPSFRYVVDRACDCPDEDARAYLAIEQMGRRSAEFPIPVESDTGILLTAPPQPVWIDDVLDVVEHALRSGSSVEIRYDRAFGYPESVVIGPNEQYEIRDFEVFGTR